MNWQRLESLTLQYPKLRIAVLGDFCLDRYLEIDPAKKEISIETGLPVYNVVKVRAQAGGAGTILNNLSALGIGEIYPIGFVGKDGEGYELRQALGMLPGVRNDGIVETEERRTFTYCKPLVLAPGQPPQELNRLDSKNWSLTPSTVQEHLRAALLAIGQKVDAVIILDQVDLADTGVVTRQLLAAIRELSASEPSLKVLADSRRSLADFPPVIFKMNLSELSRLSGGAETVNPQSATHQALALAHQNRQPVFVTMAEQGILAAGPGGEMEQVRALPLRGPIDVVGAGDAVSANLAAALAAGASLREAIELANAAASIVIHKLGTTGTANIDEIWSLVGGP